MSAYSGSTSGKSVWGSGSNSSVLPLTSSGGGSSSRGVGKGYEEQSLRLLESQNDDSVERLHSKIASLKHISVQIHDDVSSQNRYVKRLLDDMSASMDSLANRVKGSLNRLKVVLATPHNRHMVYMIAGALLFFFILILWSRSGPSPDT
ncbi:hypothetical protein BJ742DRAFT_531306 [Cladochytrium replicatum]|nr:hypothetical protein BJ742DRAFT_531306 [Cladochytrium replicatum]